MLDNNIDVLIANPSGSFYHTRSLKTISNFFILFIYFLSEYLPSDVARSIASLTALNRTEWAKIYQEHFTSGDNRKCMRAIKTAILMVTLSPESPTDLTERGKKLIHNDGKSIWFDKCINVIYFKNGHCGLNVEHSFADAPVMGHAWEFTFTKE